MAEEDTTLTSQAMTQLGLRIETITSQTMSGHATCYATDADIGIVTVAIVMTFFCKDFTAHF